LIQQRPDGPIASQTSAAAPAINVTNCARLRPHKGPLTSGQSMLITTLPNGLSSR
jgi:hypothetical protein